MATYSMATQLAWTGKIISTSEWNSYFGATGSTAYLIENYNQYYTSFSISKSVAASTSTVMTSFTIPGTYLAGTYYTTMNVVVSAANEVVADARRMVSIFVNGVAARENTYLSVLSSFSMKPIYTVSAYTKLDIGDLVEYKFLQTSTAATFVCTGTLQRVGP